MIIQEENPKEPTKNLLRLLTEINEIRKHKVIIQKSIVFLHNINDQLYIEIYKMVPFIRA